MKVVVTGGAGFIGSSLVRRLVGEGHAVTVVDNLSTGFTEHLVDLDISLVRADVSTDKDALNAACAGSDRIYHLAANADVRYGWDHPDRDLHQNVTGTLNVAEAAVAGDVTDLVFASTGSVYGEAVVTPTPEDAPFPIQTSLYGASKAAAEGFLAAYATSQRLNVTVFRFVSVLGPGYSHGHVIDFVRALRRDPGHLDVLGNGMQRKSYMHVDDCTTALTTIPGASGLETFNLGVDGFCTVRDSVGWICARMGLDPEVHYGSEDRGWVGDSPFIYLDTSRANEAGWIPQRTIQHSVVATVDWLLANPWLLESTR